MEDCDTKFKVAVWTISNFGCWRSEVHGKVITSPIFSLRGWNCSFHLYPKDFDGCGENLMMKGVPYNDQSSAATPIRFSGDLSLISSNGSVLCTQEINRVSRSGFSLTFPGLKFRDIVSQIRKNETDHQDQLSLRFRMQSASDESVECMRTMIEVYEVSFKVPSEKFDELIEGNPIQMIRFPFEDDDYDRLQIQLHERENIYSSILEFSSKSEEKVSVRTRTSVLNKDDAVVKTIEDEHIFNTNGEKKTLNSLTKEDVKEKHCSLFISVKIIPPDNCKYRGRFLIKKGIYVALTNFVKPGSFSLFSLEKSSSNPKIVTVSHRPSNPVAVLTKELMCLYQDQEFSDFQFNCGGVSFPVHKNILSARSPVFKRLLSSDMREAASGSVDIEDLDAPTLARFLAFLYTGAVGEDLHGEGALHLYYAADKYEVPSLKSECVSILCASVSVSNACEILSFANIHQDDQLMSLAHDFILRNYNEVLGSSEWENFMNREPLLAVKTVTVFAREKSVGKTSTS